MEYAFLEILHNIVCKILNNEASQEEIQTLVRDKLESKGKRNYNLHEKMDYILKKSISPNDL